MKALGILGGTFDPVHYGHLIAAEYARHEFALEKILIIPAARPPHKELQKVLGEEHRYKMVEMAIQDNFALEISFLEKDREGLSFTVDTIDYYLNKYPGVAIYFIVGADSLFLMDKWKDIERLVTLCTFVVVTRPGYIIDSDDRQLAQLPPALLDSAIYLEIPGLDISSSDIRQRVGEGKPIKYLLPPKVESYILDKGLYREEGKGSVK